MSTSLQTRWLFLDMNSFFASVEQQENPDLRGKPIIVAPVLSDSTCAIAASYEAKAFGIKTGTGVREAKALCPTLRIVPARTSDYRRYHKLIVEVLNEFFATIRVLSVDEMACRLSPLITETEEALAKRLKAAMIARMGECMTCSIGIAPNVFLAKVAADMQKPNGLVILKPEDLPHKLYSLNLRDLPGIGKRMLTRFQVNRIMTVEDLCKASSKELHRATGSIVGDRWHFMLRGHQQADYGVETDAPRKTVGHSHVLPPNMRTYEGGQTVMLRLLSKAVKRLRKYDQAACELHIYVRYIRKVGSGVKYSHWQAHTAKRHPADDEVTWVHAARSLWRTMPKLEPGCQPMMVGVTFTDLRIYEDVNLSLFEQNIKLHALAKTVDELNARFNNSVDLASVFWLREHAPDRIAFGASLLKEDTRILAGVGGGEHQRGPEEWMDVLD